MHPKSEHCLAALDQIARPPEPRVREGIRIKQPPLQP
jgi:hypothetical protein